jgi:choline dehydrogenase
VILSAGSIGSVQILERSGIGHPEVLKALDIPIKCSLQGVGGNLHDHLQLRTVFKVSSGIRTLNTIANTWYGKAKMAMEYAISRSGPLSMAPSQLGAFCSSGASGQTKTSSPDLQYHVQPLSLAKFGDPLDNFNAFTASVCNLRPTSRGNVHITSTGRRPATSSLVAINDIHPPPSFFFKLLYNVLRIYILSESQM